MKIKIYNDGSGFFNFPWIVTDSNDWCIAVGFTKRGAIKRAKKEIEVRKKREKAIIEELDVG